jgi:hypothetical protein
MCRREADVKGFGFPMPEGWLDRCCLGTSDRLCFMNGACERKQRPELRSFGGCAGLKSLDPGSPKSQVSRAP